MTSNKSNYLSALILGVTTASLSGSVGAFDIMPALPEPGTLTLLLGGVAAAVLVWRKRK